MLITQIQGTILIVSLDKIDQNHVMCNSAKDRSCPKSCRDLMLSRWLTTLLIIDVIVISARKPKNDGTAMGLWHFPLIKEDCCIALHDFVQVYFPYGAR
jgi:hypothetical protein